MSNPRRDYIERQKKICREEWFKEHRATFVCDNPVEEPVKFITVINWQNPASWNYGCRFIIHRRWLCVVGDIGEAVYEWGQDLTLEFLAQIDFGYFHSKCQASEKGRSYEMFDPEVAEKNRLERVKELTETPDEDKGEDDKKELEILSDSSRIAFEEYSEIARDYYHETGDVEGASSISTMGTVPDARCIGHFIGLKMAIEQLTRK
jgi:hypothetical protein